MRRYKMSTFLSEAIKGIYRNPLSSIVSIISLILALLVMGTFFMLKVNLDYNLDSIGDFRTIIFYMEHNADEEDIETVTNYIASTFNISAEDNIKLTTKEEALKAELEKSPEFVKYYQGDANPLPHSLTVSYPENLSDAALAQRIDMVTELDEVDTARNRKDIADKISNLKKVVNTVSTALLVMLFFVSVFVIGNTVKLTHEARKSEIKIMRYIGAINFFIEFPFILEGVILGLISSITSYAIVVFAYNAIVSNFSSNYGNIINFLSLKNDVFSFIPNLNYYVFLLAAFVLTGLLTGILGTFTTKKHLKA